MPKLLVDYNEHDGKITLSNGFKIFVGKMNDGVVSQEDIHLPYDYTKIWSGDIKEDRVYICISRTGYVYAAAYESEKDVFNLYKSSEKYNAHSLQFVCEAPPTHYIGCEPVSIYTSAKSKLGVSVVKDEKGIYAPYLYDFENVDLLHTYNFIGKMESSRDYSFKDDL